MSRSFKNSNRSDEAGREKRREAISNFRSESRRRVLGKTRDGVGYESEEDDYYDENEFITGIFSRGDSISFSKLFLALKDNKNLRESFVKHIKEERADKIDVPVDKLGNTILHYAAVNNDIEMIRFLTYEMSANLFVKNARNNIPLSEIFASQSNDVRRGMDFVGGNVPDLDDLSCVEFLIEAFRSKFESQIDFAESTLKEVVKSCGKAINSGRAQNLLGVYDAELRDFYQVLFEKEIPEPSLSLEETGLEAAFKKLTTGEEKPPTSPKNVEATKVKEVSKSQIPSNQ